MPGPSPLLSPTPPAIFRDSRCTEKGRVGLGAFSFIAYFGDTSQLEKKHKHNCGDCGMRSVERFLTVCSWWWSNQVSHQTQLVLWTFPFLSFLCVELLRTPPETLFFDATSALYSIVFGQCSSKKQESFKNNLPLADFFTAKFCLGQGSSFACLFSCCKLFRGIK